MGINLADIGANQAEFWYQASKDYFKGFRDLFSPETKPADRCVALLIVLSSATIILPIGFGIVYGISKGLSGRAKPIKIEIGSPRPAAASALTGVPPSELQLLQLAKKTDIVAKETNIVGGGVLPYYIDPSDGTAYLLLGLEEANLDWSDFGGKIDAGEKSMDTAARECCEEIRGLLGNKEAIKTKIAGNSPIGMLAPTAKYAMYLMKVEDRNEIKSEVFVGKKVADSHAKEKINIVWLKALDVFNAVRDGGNKMTINGIPDQLRPCFATTLRRALNSKENDSERSQIENLLGSKNMPDKA